MRRDVAPQRGRHGRGPLPSGGEEDTDPRLTRNSKLPRRLLGGPGVHKKASGKPPCLETNQRTFETGNSICEPVEQSRRGSSEESVVGARGEMASALKNAARAVSQRVLTQVGGQQARGMAKKGMFYNPNMPIENWAIER